MHFGTSLYWIYLSFDTGWIQWEEAGGTLASPPPSFLELGGSAVIADDTECLCTILEPVMRVQVQKWLFQDNIYLKLPYFVQDN